MSNRKKLLVVGKISVIFVFSYAIIALMLRLFPSTFVTMIGLGAFLCLYRFILQRFFEISRREANARTMLSTICFLAGYFLLNLDHFSLISLKLDFFDYWSFNSLNILTPYETTTLGFVSLVFLIFGAFFSGDSPTNPSRQFRIKLKAISLLGLSVIFIAFQFWGNTDLISFLCASYLLGIPYGKISVPMNKYFEELGL